MIDNPAVSGHHARVFLEDGRYVVEDLRSRNGTYVNEKHVVRHALQNGDVLLVGKHKLVFDEMADAEPAPAKPVVPTLGKTAYLDTKKHRALLTKLRDDRARERAEAQASSGGGNRPGTLRPGMEKRGGTLNVIAGQSEKSEYRLDDDRTSFIGKSEAALVRVRGWFAPRAVAAIAPTDQGYAVTPLSRKVLINSARLEGTRELKDGDLLEFNGLILRFQFTERSPQSSAVELAGAPSTAESDGEASVA